MDAKKYPEHLGLFVARLDPFQKKVFFVSSEAPLQSCRPLLCYHFSEQAIVLMVLCPFALSLEVGLDTVVGDKVAVYISGVDGIRTKHSCFGLEEGLGEPYGLFEPCALIEVVEGQVFDEADAVHLQLVDLCPELHGLDLLSPDNGPDVGSVKTDDAPRWLYALIKLLFLLP